jgi:histidine triad (HIT) family protein
MEYQNCIFCKIAAGDIPCSKVYEDESVIAFLDVNPLSEGHTLVIPKAHFDKLDQCPSEVLASIADCTGKVASAVVSGLGCDGYNVLCNNGAAAGQEVDHVHFHVIPRNSGDQVFTQWPAKQYSDGQAENILNKISENI